MLISKQDRQPLLCKNTLKVMIEARFGTCRNVAEIKKKEIEGLSNKRPFNKLYW